MGFFGKIFKKSPSGSLFGNLLRGVVSSATGGLLGNGAMLRARNAREVINAPSKPIQKFDTSKAFASGFNSGIPIGLAIDSEVERLKATPQGKEIEKKMTMNWLKSNWYYLVGSVLVITGVTYLIVKRK